jgi:hypothetical protein
MTYTVSVWRKTEWNKQMSDILYCYVLTVVKLNNRSHMDNIENNRLYTAIFKPNLNGFID